MDLKIFLVFLFALNLSQMEDGQNPNQAGCHSLPNITLHHHTVLTNLNLPVAEGNKIGLNCLPLFTDANKGFVDYTCTDGNWDETGTINCDSCVPLSEPSNGVIVLNPVIGETTRIQCNEGYKTLQLNGFVCQENGSYTPDNYDPSSICTKVTCEEPENVDHSSMVSSKRGSVYHYNDTAKFTCDEDYELKGEGTVKCLATGNWSEFPLCVLVSSCTSAQTTTRSSCEKAKVLKNHVTFKCDASIDKSTSIVGNNDAGDYEYQCASKEDPDPTKGCFCDCLIDHPGIIITEKHIVSKNTKKWLRHGHTLVWKCANSAVEKLSHAPVTCTDGVLSTDPQCRTQPTTRKEYILRRKYARYLRKRKLLKIRMKEGGWDDTGVKKTLISI